MSLYAREITALHTKIPTDTRRRGLLAIVVTRDDIQVLSCVNTAASPSRFATTSAVLVVGTYQFTTFQRFSRAAMSIGASKKRTRAIANVKTMAHEKTKII